MNRKRCCPLAGLVIGLLLVIIGLIIQFGVVPAVFNQNIEIRNGSIQYKNWYRPTVPVRMQWYVFNLTNMDNVTANREKPRFEQLGPYTYIEHRWKTDVQWHDNGTVTYKNLRWWNFEPDSNSTLSEDDIIYSINLPLLTVAESLRYESFFLKEAFSLLAAHYDEKLYKKYTMKQLIWGYHDPMMTAGRDVMPDWFYTDFVGVFAGKNYTDDGVWTVSTGEKDISTVGQTVAYNGSKSLSFWSSKYANMVNGTDGTIGKPHLSKTEDDIAYFFIPDVCRTLYGMYAEDEKTSKGITLYRYTSTAEELKNAQENPDNSGFCTPAGNCILGNGMLNLSTCQSLDYFHVPVIASLPHFLFADQKYLDMVEGLHPVEEEHRTDIAIEPITGIVMRIAKRLQINMYVRRVDYLPILEEVNEMVFPVAWLNESAVVDDKNQDLYFSMMELLNAARIICYVLYAVGGLLVVVAALYLLCTHIKGRSGSPGEREPLLSSAPANVNDGDSTGSAGKSATATDSSYGAAAANSSADGD